MQATQFISKLMQTDIGRKIVAEDERTHASARHEAAVAISAAHARADADLARIDRMLPKVQARVERASSELVAAQQELGDLRHARELAERARKDAIRTPRATLVSTTPAQLREFIDYVRWLAIPRHQNSMNAGVPTNADAEFLALQPRATAVLARAEALVFDPAADLDAILPKLRRELAVPPSVAARWQEFQRLNVGMAA